MTGKKKKIEIQTKYNFYDCDGVNTFINMENLFGKNEKFTSTRVTKKMRLRKYLSNK